MGFCFTEDFGPFTGCTSPHRNPYVELRNLRAEHIDVSRLLSSRLEYATHILREGDDSYGLCDIRDRKGPQ